MYRELFVPVDNSEHSDWAVDLGIEIARRSGGRITGNHVYAARLHDVRFRQLETGLPAQFQTPQEIKKQRKIHDKLIEKGLQLIADSFLDQVGGRCAAAGVPLVRQLLEGINYEEIAREANRGEGRLPGLIGFDPNRAARTAGSWPKTRMRRPAWSEPRRASTTWSWPARTAWAASPGASWAGSWPGPSGTSRRTS
jgi:nucleotide-binding universal stress UspA family protein